VSNRADVVAPLVEQTSRGTIGRRGREDMATNTPVNIGNLIYTKPNFRGRRPCLVGTGTTVHTIVATHLGGLSADRIRSCLLLWGVKGVFYAGPGSRPTEASSITLPRSPQTRPAAGRNPVAPTLTCGRTAPALLTGLGPGRER
jgi:hypothetical protein